MRSSPRKRVNETEGRAELREAAGARLQQAGAPAAAASRDKGPRPREGEGGERSWRGGGGREEEEREAQRPVAAWAPNPAG